MAAGTSTASSAKVTKDAAQKKTSLPAVEPKKQPAAQRSTPLAGAIAEPVTPDRETKAEQALRAAQKREQHQQQKKHKQQMLLLKSQQARPQQSSTTPAVFDWKTSAIETAARQTKAIVWIACHFREAVSITRDRLNRRKDSIQSAGPQPFQSTERWKQNDKAQREKEERQREKKKRAHEKRLAEDKEAAAVSEEPMEVDGGSPDREAGNDADSTTEVKIIQIACDVKVLIPL